MSNSLEGKIILITGAGGFIGSECTIYLSKLGAKMIACDINESALMKTKEAVEEAGGFCMTKLCDVTDSASVNSVFDSVEREIGPIYATVHVAGGSARIAGPEAQYRPLALQEDYVIDRVLKVNLYGAMYVARAAASQMIRNNIQGRILSFSSIVGMNGLSKCSEYAAAKAGIIAMTKSLAKEVGEFGITANTVAPGIVMRPENKGGDHRALDTNVLHRKCVPADIVGLVAFLLSEEAGFITGQTYVVDGGRSLAMKGSD